MTVQLMRTTIDLPDDLHRAAKAIAHDRHQSLSEAITDIMRSGLGGNEPLRMITDPETGFRIATGGRVLTHEEVRSLDDEDCAPRCWTRAC